MFRIRRFSVIKTSNVVALIYMVVVAIFAVPFALIFAIAGTTSQAQGAGAIGGVVLGLVVIFFYGLLGWVFTAIACVIYNLVAGWIGGIEVQVEAVAPPPPPPAWISPTPPPTSPAPPTAPPSDPLVRVV
jgi:hypothetical protein